MIGWAAGKRQGGKKKKCRKLYGRDLEKDKKNGVKKERVVAGRERGRLTWQER